MNKLSLLLIIAASLVIITGCTIDNPVAVVPEKQSTSEEEKVPERFACGAVEACENHYDKEPKESTNEEASEEHEHDHSVEIKGSDLKALSVQEVADLWEISSETLLIKIIAEFKLQGDYTVDTTLEEIRNAEYKFSPAIIKDLAESIKS